VFPNGEKVGEMPHPYEDSCGTRIHMNEKDEKLNTSTTEKKGQRSVLFIEGVEIFLPSSQGEVGIFVAEVEAKGQQVDTFMEEEKKILKSAPT
jgi:hypothetical protein